METASMELPRYKSHKTVRAARITGFRQNGNVVAPSILLGDIGGLVTQAPEWFQKHNPQIGGYYVLYEDGYASFSPAKAFEDGYTPIDNDAPAKSVEQSIQAAGANRAPRVTPGDVEAEIAGEHYFTAADAGRAVTSEMVDRFLGWKLPADFSPDCGVSFKRESDYEHPEFGRTKFEPTGTNLFDAHQAKAMLEHVLQPQPEHDALRLLTFCVLILRNGFTVTGQSACASPENFNADIGRRIAREDAVRQVWPLLGFRLRDRLSTQNMAGSVIGVAASFYANRSK